MCIVRAQTHLFIIVILINDTLAFWAIFFAHNRLWACRHAIQTYTLGGSIHCHTYLFRLATLVTRWGICTLWILPTIQTYTMLFLLFWIKCPEGFFVALFINHWIRLTVRKFAPMQTFTLDAVTTGCIFRAGWALALFHAIRQLSKAWADTLWQARIAVHATDTIVTMFVTDRAAIGRDSPSRTNTVPALVTAALACLWCTDCLTRWFSGMI
jgi:hypothetical protein